MSRIVKTIIVDAPIDTVYGQWTQFETFPTFMEGLDKVDQLDDRTLDWTATVAGRTKTWQARPSNRSATGSASWTTGSARFSAGSRTSSRVGACRPGRGTARSTGDEASPGVTVDPSLPSTTSTTRADESRDA